MPERLKSPVLWIACLALFAFVTKTWMGWDIPQFDTFAELLLAVLVGFGVINNPTDKKHF